MLFVVRLTHTISMMSLLFLSACAVVPKQADYTSMINNEQETIETWSQLEPAVQTTYLNQLIDSNELDALIKKALEANPNLQQTLLTLKIHQSQIQQTKAQQKPTLETNYSVQKIEDSESTYSDLISVSWEVDIWKKLSDQTNASIKDAEQQAALYQSARDALCADVMQTWLNLIAEHHAIEIEQRRLTTLQNNEKFILQRYKNGLGDLQEMYSAQSAVSSSRASLEANIENRAQLQRSLSLLVGQSRHNIIPITTDYPEVVLPLANLPEQTLQRRPDLKAAYLAIQADEYRTKVAYKNMLPSINLSAPMSSISGSPASALLSQPVWSLLAQLTAPIYNGGALQATAKAAELETAYQYQVYRETLLSAVKEVEDALGQEHSLLEQQTHIEAALDSAYKTLQQYQNSYRNGLVNILDLLNVQQQSYDLEAQLNTIIYTRLANRIVLGLALGLPFNTQKVSI